ncbi:MAG: hypothetical protein AB7O31_07735 [Burkholderiales bacterium]
MPLACLSAPKQKPVPPAPKPTAEDVAVVRESWLARYTPCNVPISYTKHYLACLRVYVSRLPRFDASRREHFGEHYDPDRYYDCRRRKEPNIASGCAHFALHRKENPEHWPFHKVPPIKWPEAPKEPVYKAGMKPFDYWLALCKAEAGEFIYKTVKDVTSIYQVRPRAREPEYALGDRYALEDPYGYIESESGDRTKVPWVFVGPGWTSPKSPGSYPVFETPSLPNNVATGLKKSYPLSLWDPIPADKHYQRYSGFDRANLRTMKVEYVAHVQSRYGWTWRGIKRPRDRELAIAGGELAVVDLMTGEILGLRRGFIAGARAPDVRVNWFFGNVCPAYSQMPGMGRVRSRNKDIDFTVWFIDKVLLPIGQFPR